MRADRANLDLDPFDIDDSDTMKNGRVIDRQPHSAALRIEDSEDESDTAAPAASSSRLQKLTVTGARAVTLTVRR